MLLLLLLLLSIMNQLNKQKKILINYNNSKSSIRQTASEYLIKT